jgi:hypothetical protein
MGHELDGLVAAGKSAVEVVGSVGAEPADKHVAVVADMTAGGVAEADGAVVEAVVGAADNSGSCIVVREARSSAAVHGVADTATAADTVVVG